MIKPYQQVPIVECEEPLVAIPADTVALQAPHAYASLGAPYGEASPFYLRQGVLDALLAAQDYLQQRQPGWRLQVFDAYRPIAVQQFMVDYTFSEYVQAQGWVVEQLTEEQRHDVWQQVYQFWANPSLDPKMPPPHSTGAAIDLTLLDAAGEAVFMGSAIDELSPRSHPEYFAQTVQELDGSAAELEAAQLAADHRQLLYEAMTAAGFQRHPQEWWHFSLGDQLWAWLSHQKHPDQGAVARYGCVAL